MKEERDLQPSYRRMLFFVAACAVAVLAIGAAVNRTPILRGYLQGPLDGNGQSITNAGNVETTNLTVKGGTVSGVTVGVTNGDNSISIVSTSGVHHVRATNITEAKLLLTDNTTADGSTSAHGFLPKVSATSNSVAMNWNGAFAWKVLTNLIRAGSNVLFLDTNGIVTIHVDTSTATEALQNKTIDASNNTLKMRGYITLASPFICDGVGAIIVTNDNTAAIFGQARMHGTNAASANWVEYRITVPEDIDTSVDLKVERFKFRLGGSDTGGHSYVLTQAAVADSASYDSPSLSQSVTLTFAGDGSGASGDVETVSSVTLTNWAGNVTAGRLWVIRLARNGDTDASTVNSYSGPLVISYGITQ